MSSIAGVWRAQFLKNVQDLNYGRRAKLLSSLGQQLGKQLPENNLNGVLVDLPHDDTFSALSVLAVLQGVLKVLQRRNRRSTKGFVGCSELPFKLLGHPSQIVRFKAATLLDAPAAEKAFLSEEFSKQLKLWLVRSCAELPCTPEILQHALKFFPQDIVWLVLQKTDNEQLLREWVDHLTLLWPTNGLPGLERLACDFPDTLLQLLNSEGYFVEQSWGWVLPLAQHRPRQLLEQVCITNGGRKLFNPRMDLTKRLLQWAWRHQHCIMIDICKAVAESHAAGSCRSRPSWTTACDLVALQQEIVSSHACPTVRTKIQTLVSVFLALPEEQHSITTAKRFLQLMPSTQSDAGEVVKAFWQIVNDLGRGRLAEILSSGIFASVAKKLPPPLVVDNFFRFLPSVEPETSVYRFVQSEICKTTDGKHDVLMQKVFERFLTSEQSDAVVYVESFQALLQDAVSMDVIQSAYNTLTARLRGATDRVLLQAVVARMAALDRQFAESQEPSKYPPRQLPLPTEWLWFVPPPDRCSPPYVTFMYSALGTWARSAEALQEAVEKFGTAVFWSTLEHVIHCRWGDASSTSSVRWNHAAVDFVELARVTSIAPVDKHFLQACHPGDTKRARGPESAVAYFTGIDAKKKQTFGRDADKRTEAYQQMISDASKDGDVLAALNDLLPFMVARFGGEQENVQYAVMSQLLPQFKVDVWISQQQQLEALWKVWKKASGRVLRGWQTLGCAIVRHVLMGWRETDGARELCLLGADMAQGSVDFASLLAELVTMSKDSSREAEPACEEAVEWIVHTAVPLAGQSEGVLVCEDATRQPLQDFCKLLSAAAKQLIHVEDGERGLWQRFSVFRNRWEALLREEGTSLIGAEFVLVGVVEHWVRRQKWVSRKSKKSNKRDLWWEPLQSKAYGAAVQRVLQMIETCEIPMREGAVMIAKRSQIIQIMEKITKMASDHWPDAQRYDWSRLSSDAWYLQPTPAVDRSHLEATLLDELKVLSKLMSWEDVPRQVLWSVVHATEGLAGATSDKLLEKLLSMLDARREGMVCCIANRYPHLQEALADAGGPYPVYYDEQAQRARSDLMTPALELWLDNVAHRDARVVQLMSRADAHHLLFFGNTLAEHLSMQRQELLHRCLESLELPQAEGVPSEFYHHAARIPALVRLAQFGKGWRTATAVHDPSVAETAYKSTFFWHPETQALFLQKGLTSTEMKVLTITPGLEFVNGIERAGELLGKHPLEQTGPVPDVGWTVIRSGGSYQDLWCEVERRFAEAGPPGSKNSIGDREVDKLLSSLGRADHALDALKILGKYASKFKRAKEALMLALPNLSPPHVRRVIEEICFTPEAGISLQVAALKVLMDLRVPNPLQLYRVAWRDGVCHRDVAAIILKKIATSPITDWTADEVRDMFNIFDRNSEAKLAKPEQDMLPIPDGKSYPTGTYQAMSAANKDNHDYIANIVLEALEQTRMWSLPYLPEIVAGLALLPGSTHLAIRALQRNQNQVSEVVVALTTIIRQARLAALLCSDDSTSPSKKRHLTPKQLLLSELAGYTPKAGTEITRHLMSMELATCDQGALRGLVDELLLQAETRKAQNHKYIKELREALAVWVNILTKPIGEEAISSWESTLRSMEHETITRFSTEGLMLLADAVADHLPTLKLSRQIDGPWVWRIVSCFYERALEGLTEGKASQIGTPGLLDDACKAVHVELKAARHRIVVDHWAVLFAQGCQPEDDNRLFEQCPPDALIELAHRVVDIAKTKLWWVGDGPQVVQTGAAESAARRALHWLAASCGEGAVLSTLAQLWPKVLVSDRNGDELHSVLQLLGKQPGPHCQAFAAGMLHCGPSHLCLRTLQWLGSIFPREAVQLWPKFLQATGTPNGIADVAELLRLCEANNMVPPELPQTAWSPAVIRLFAGSSLPVARGTAVRRLQSLDLQGSHAHLAEILSSLRSDDCAIVSIAANAAWETVVDIENA